MEHKGANDMERGSPVQDGGKRGAQSLRLTCDAFRFGLFGFANV